MIISTSRNELVDEFNKLMGRTDDALNNKAKNNPTYFKNKGGKKLEVEVYNALTYCAQGTRFEGSIELVSGISFPDIIANRYFGVEVKSTEQNRWCSIGSSILETTRDNDIERIFMTFGKLGEPTKFKSKPYEECLSDIVVTHYPRYRIDMQLQEKGEQTIFQKMGVAYDDFRQMENPVPVVSKYYKEQLGPGETLWWMGDDIENQGVSPKLRLWTSLENVEQDGYRAVGCVLFPELISSNSTSKYQRFALWLATEQSIIHTNVRDTFSAGGRYRGVSADGKPYDLPQVYGKLYMLRDYIKSLVGNLEESLLMRSWDVEKVEHDRLKQWMEIVLSYASTNEQEEIRRFFDVNFEIDSGRKLEAAK